MFVVKVEACALFDICVEAYVGALPHSSYCEGKRSEWWRNTGRLGRVQMFRTHSKLAGLEVYHQRGISAGPSTTLVTKVEKDSLLSLYKPVTGVFNKYIILSGVYIAA
jgi:hypothetical protein